MATIDELSAALIKADAAGNAADAQVFADEIRRLQAESAPVAAAPAASEIPGKRAEPKPFDLGDFARGVVETPGVLLTGAAGQLAGNVYGPIRSAIEGKYGTREGVQLAQKYAGEAAEALSYAPRTETGKNIVSGVSNFLNESKLAGLNPYTAGELSALANPAMRQSVNALRNEAGLIKSAVAPIVQERVGQKALAQASQSYQNAAQIDAANLAIKHGIALNPAEANPTKVNRLVSNIAGTANLNENLSKINEVKFTNLAKKDMGLPPNTVLNAKAFEKALSQHSAPYDAVRKIPQLAAPAAVLDEINQLHIVRPTIGGESSAAAVNSLVAEAVTKLKEGRSGAEVLTDIRKLRKDAKSIYNTQQKSGVPDATLVAKADANMSIANALENLIEANVADPKLLADLRKARSEMAKIYDYERATNFATNRIDPHVLAKLAEEGKPLSGIAADIGKIVAVFPDIAQSGKTGKPFWAPERLTRSGTAGTLGYAVGGLPGAIVGAVGGNITSGLAGRAMSKPGYQERFAVPRDFRSQTNNLAPKGTNNLRND